MTDAIIVVAIGSNFEFDCEFVRQSHFYLNLADLERIDCINLTPYCCVRTLLDGLS